MKHMINLKPPAFYVAKSKNFERMAAELSKYISAMEMDTVVDFMSTIADSKFDINPSVEDSKTQMEIILGRDRYQEVVAQWKKDNQKLLSDFGQLKYRQKSTGELFDGLDAEDKTEDFDKYYV